MEADAAADSPTIRQINRSAVHKICAGQVILDLSSAVKELVENSLDAGATSIEIALKEYGEEWFQVVDNGYGISPSNFKVLALKYHTSKLSDFPDLQSLTTFGFRGEALSSLCALGDLTVETRTKNEPVATHLTFDHSGLLTAERKTARQVGTTVTVKKLFANLPVRSKEFKRNIRKEYGKLISLLNAYALIAKGVRIVCTNTSGRNVKSVVLKTQGSDCLRDNIITVFGINTFNCLEPVTICILEGCKVDGFLSKSGQGSGRNLGDRQFFFVNGRPVDMPKVSKLLNELYKGSNSKQYPIAVMNFTIPTGACDVNVTPDKRKIFFSDESSILHALREGLQKIYSSANVSYSVNKVEDSNKESDNSQLNSWDEKSSLLTDKSGPGDVFPEETNKIQNNGDDVPLQKYKDRTQTLPAFEAFIQPRDQTLTKRDFTLRVHDGKRDDCSISKHLTTHSNSQSIDRNPVIPSSVAEREVANCSRSVQSSLNKFVTLSKRKHESISSTLSEMPILRNHNLHCQLERSRSEMDDMAKEAPVNPRQVGVCAEVNKSPPNNFLSETISSDIGASGVSTNDREHLEELVDQEKSVPLADEIPTFKYIESVSEDVSVANTSLQSPGIISDVEVRNQNIFSKFHFSFKDLQARRQKRFLRLQSNGYRSQRPYSKRFFAAATLELSQPENEERKARALAAATTELERLFQKKDFSRMKVVGQFNLGFIIGKLDHDLFIVDQHAADEKFNFERLSQSTILNQQPLLRPLRLELSPEEEVVASMHMDIFRKNGFSLEEDPDAPPGQHFRLTAVPFSKNILFGVEDVKDLISTLADGQGECAIIGSYRSDTSNSVCPSRVRAMLASRACRSSVMIGDALGRNEMQKILEHLADLKSPWNCPHGRPTMRHLVDLTTLRKQSDELQESQPL